MTRRLRKTRNTADSYTYGADIHIVPCTITGRGYRVEITDLPHTEIPGLFAGRHSAKFMIQHWLNTSGRKYGKTP